MAEGQIKVQLNPDVPPTGSDLGVVNAARKSFGKRSDWDYKLSADGYPIGKTLKPSDLSLLKFLARGMSEKDFTHFVGNFKFSLLGDSPDDLIKYLWDFRNTPTHDTPFNHGFFSFEVKAPIFVRSHLVKHEYLIMSEYSRRYITEDIEFYSHTYRNAAENKKQGSSGVSEHTIKYEVLSSDQKVNAVDLYNKMVEGGVAPEQARGVLPQDLMTAWTWSGTLGAFCNMCKLRLHKDTQKETSFVSERVYYELCKQFPISAPLLVKGFN